MINLIETEEFNQYLNLCKDFSQLDWETYNFYYIQENLQKSRTNKVVYRTIHEKWNEELKNKLRLIDLEKANIDLQLKKWRIL